MFRPVFIFILVASGLVGSCKKEQSIHPLGIDIQSYFNQDNVQVLVDGQEVLHKKLTTHQVLGVCYDEGQTSNTQNDGNHQIKVIINNSVIKTENFSLQDDLYIGVNYDGANISFVYSGERFMYD